MFSSFYQSPVGLLQIIATENGISSVLFLDGDKEAVSCPENKLTKDCKIQLAEYFEGKRKVFDILLDPVGTDFQKSVWKLLCAVPFGKTDSYMSLAKALNNPLSIRAVGAANGKNPIAIIIPCHRIIGSNGSLTGYAGGLWRKEWLLKHEGVKAFQQPTLF